ncbi:MAG: hypothetical protein WKI04_04760 [Ferruginibacter sp.]
MNTHSPQQEILLLINTSFSSRTWAKINESLNDRKLSRKEQLMEACWNGLTPEMLPECFENSHGKFITLWGITDANTFIDLEFGDFMQRKENQFSVNPYAFMQVQGYN